MTIKYTPSQEKALSLVKEYGERNDRLFILWYGGIRAGKTYGMVRAGIEHSLTREHDNYIIGGYVLRSIINNVTPYFTEICKELGLKYKLVAGGVNPRIEVGSNQFLFYGGDRAKRSSNVQGATASGLLIDEFELLDRDFVKQCEGRVSNDGALRIYTSNKGQPYSWAKREYYDRAINNEIDAVVIDSNPAENIFVDAGFWEEKTSEYDDYYRKRFIDNEFALDVAPLYEPQRVKLDIDKLDYRLTTIYSYGRSHFNIPVYYDGDNKVYILGDIQHMEIPIDVSLISRYGTVLINSNASVLAREMIKNRFDVRGYSDMFMPHKVELCQRAFGYGRVMLLDNATLTIEQIEKHAFQGMNEDAAIDAIESCVEYLARINRWG